MKITAIILLATCLQASAAGFGQRVTISEKNIPVRKVLNIINQQTGFHFLFEDELLEKAGKIDINVKDTPVDYVLKICFRDLPVGFTISRKTIVVVPLESKKTELPPNLPTPPMEIHGVVMDENGKPLEGASVKLKGAEKGTVTDQQGTFTLHIPADGGILVVSYVGYETMEVPVSKTGALRIVLKPAVSTAEEMVVVAHGTQKKKEIVGAMTTINPAELKIPVSNLTNALAGKLAGIIAYQRSGEPGFDNADFFIRGVTTFGYRTSPLILIDNVEVDATALARLQVDDIASFSIMKDATATALYGSKGANGVILITTKEGKEGKVNVSFRAENSLSQSTRNVQLADPITYMQLADEAILTRNPLGGLLYPRDKIENTRNHTDPAVFPATDWQKMLLKDATMNQRFNLNLSGGGKVARYYVSGSFNLDNGILKVDPKTNFNSNSRLRSYSIRSNININLTPTTELNTRVSGTFDDYTGPVKGGTDIFNQIMQSNPVLFPAYYQPTPATKYVRHIMFGNTADGSYNNPYADLQSGYKQYNQTAINAQVNLRQKLNFITEGLSARGMLNIQRNSYFDLTRSYNPFYYVVSNYDYFGKTYDLTPINLEAGQSSAPAGTEYLNYQEGKKVVSSSFYGEAALDYRRTFNVVHSLSGTLVAIAKNDVTGNAGDLESSLPFRNVGLSGRASYIYDDRYAAEFNFGYNGSERFYITHRFGFFPSAGVAYTVSNERFWAPMKSFWTKLKLRATYGFVGNDAIGSATDRFFYLSNVDMNSGSRGMQFGTLAGYGLTGIDIKRYANNDITWEKSRKTNLGMEATFFHDLNITVDAYQEKRTNILMPRASIPSTMGLSAPLQANVGQSSAKGVDIALDYSQQITRKWWAKAMANFTYATSRYDVYEEPSYPAKNRIHVGRSLGQQWGYIAERLFVDDLDAKNAPQQNFGPYGGGDVKYRDISGDGKITEDDLAPIGYPLTPEIVYGFGISTGYGHFDASVFFEGLARESFWIDAVSTSPFVGNQRQLLKVWADNHWSEDNRNIYALWPRLSTDVNKNNTQTSTWWMRDGSLMRIKSLEFGYTLSSAVMNRLHLSNARFYVNGVNLFTFSRFNLWDVEMGGNGLGYPIQRVINAGITLSIK